MKIEPIELGISYDELCETIEGFKEQSERIANIKNKTLSYKPFRSIIYKEGT